ncbi:dTDP-4-amino-4,6-dideoxygalactose transaminase [Syntrophus gentianae]|uniref:dTDP-4-amino-4,6-dideoxygalactose transaminase n=1 Tax=Syntrophus gentianae TaxID=43775 RepID=A0A1H7V6H2_9BACT|nr:DegT/DnrJ/EryC1/StrS family aminotransferase [Syntrophus gentianae]SEM04826.1 dTDP-4-amino-4,6-dideoxygalactose transaminase [Syntrophus gentianae]
MHFIDLAAQQQRIRKILEEKVLRVMDHGQYIMGPEIKMLEEELAAFTGVKHAVACSSGTDALLMALMAYGVGPGDAIFTTPFTFIATAEVVALLGATPVFVDIDPRTYNIDPEKLELAISAVKENNPQLYPLPATRNSQTLTPRGIIPVDLFGLPADYDLIKAIAQEHGLFVVEDAAQAFGAEYHGKKAGSLADIACTSFFPAKPLGGYGDGGMCFTDSDTLADSMISVRIHGMGSDRYDNIRVGINGRLDTLQAAILLAKFSLFPEEVTLRQQVAERYSSLLAENESIVVPYVPEGYLSVWAQYSLLACDGALRSALQDALQKEGIPTAVYYPKPLHVQTAFTALGYKPGDFPVSDNCAERIFSLPMHPYLKEDDQKRIAAVINRI